MSSHSVNARTADSPSRARADRTKTFASLCSRESLATASSVTMAARMPVKRFAMMLMPMPVVHNSTPRSAFPSSTASQTGTAKSV